MEFEKVITGRTELTEILGEPGDLVKNKVINEIDSHCRGFIAQSPFLAMSTSSSAGECDVTPRGDGPGFVKVLDRQTLLIPERRGNRRADSLNNILGNPYVGLIFFIPGLVETLRINGTAQIIADEALLEEMAVKGRAPQVAIAVTVAEAFIHCGKAMKRSGLWETDRWPHEDRRPEAAAILTAHAKRPEKEKAAISLRLEEGYKNRLY